MSDLHSCPFCGDPEKVIEKELVFAHYDTYPVSEGHCLIITRRHVAEYFQATAAEKAAIWELVDEVKTILDRDFSPDGYNVGVNIGRAAGQSIPHLHIHVIPRYEAAPFKFHGQSMADPAELVSTIVSRGIPALIRALQAAAVSGSAKSDTCIPGTWFIWATNPLPIQPSAEVPTRIG